MAVKKPQEKPKRKRPAVEVKASDRPIIGRPEKWTQELLEIEAKALREWVVQPRSLWLKGFAYERGYKPQNLTEFAAKSMAFSEALEFAKDEQERKFIYGAWSKEMDMAFVKHFMPRMLRDRPEWKTSWDQIEEKIDEKPTTVIINKIEK